MEIWGFLFKAGKQMVPGCIKINFKMHYCLSVIEIYLLHKPG